MSSSRPSWVTMPNNLLASICDLTNPTDGEPSLWEQLNTGVQQDAPLRRGAVKSKPPTATGPLSIIADIERWTRGCWGRGVPNKLRGIEESLRWHEKETAEWAVRVAAWVVESRQVLGLIRQVNVSLPRGTRCHGCGNAWVSTTNPDDQLVREPALVLMWVEPEREQVDRFGCRSCGQEWPASELHDLVEYQSL